MRAWPLVGTLTAASLLGSMAVAQERFGSAGGFALSGERLFGFNRETWTNEDAGVEISVTDVSFSLLINQGSALFGEPRIGGDYFLIAGLSFGTAVGWGTHKTGGSHTLLLIAPRIGYAAMFSDTVGIWPRGGITYVAMSSSSSGFEDATHLLDMTLEAPFVLSPFPHAAFLIGPTFDLGLSGSFWQKSAGERAETIAVKVTDIGVQAGIAVVF